MNDIITILNQINILYDRKNNLEQLTLLLNGNVPKEKNLFSDDGKVITNIKLALKDIDLNKIKDYLPDIEKGNIEDAKVGAIQDPASSAIGSTYFPYVTKGIGNPVSKAIYEKFDDLKPIPPITQNKSIFNSTTGKGKKILHTQCYVSYGDPTKEKDRQIQIQNIEDSYYKAFVEFNDGKGKLDSNDKGTLNLVPLPGNGGKFEITKDTKPYNYNVNHLHPSYIILGLLKAINRAVTKFPPIPIPLLCIYFNDANVAKDAKIILDELFK